MKTAISLPEDLYKSADTLGEAPRNEPQWTHRGSPCRVGRKAKHTRITERLNAVYAVNDGRLEPGMIAAARRILASSEWEE